MTSYTYDNKDLPDKHTDQLLAFETFQYDKNDNSTSITDRKNHVTNTTYDALNRPKVITHVGNSTITLTFDAGNRLTQLVDSVGGSIVLTYDLLDRLTSEAGPNGTVNYTYDAANRRTTMTVTGQPVVNYTYDNGDRLTQITQGASTVSITYDTAGRRSTLTLPNGVVVTYGYDGLSRLNNLTYTKGLNLIGNLNYVYDAAGRRTQMGGSLARTGLPPAIASASYNAANRLTQWNGVNLTYDANGIMTGDGTNTYTWDARDQLTSITGPGLSAGFQYDALGRRLTKTINTAATGFLYDSENTVQELAGGSPAANLLTGLGLDETYTRTDSSGTSTLMVDGSNSTIAVLDAAGAMPTQFTYEPFGKATTTGAANGNSLQYTGRENDNTGLYYYRARYYHPGLPAAKPDRLSDP